MAFALWITGVPGSGKSAVAKKLSKKISAEILRLDEIRKVVTPKPSYSKEEKLLVYRFLAYLGKSLVDKGVNVIFDATDELGEGRKTARKIIRNFAVISLKCPAEICEKREKQRKDKAGMKDLYKRARQGKIKLAGFNAPYFRDKKPLLLIETDKISIDASAEAIVEKVKYEGWFPIEK